MFLNLCKDTQTKGHFGEVKAKRLMGKGFITLG